MGILSDFFGKQASSKSPLEKFETIKTFVQQKTESLMNKDFEGMSPEEAANKIMYQTMDQAIREKLSEEENKKVDRANEVKNVLDTLKEEVGSGRMTEAELATILESKEFNDYANNENPTYDQMLKMNEDDFKKWLTLRNETDREKLLAEMIDHEERTGSFRKTAKKEISGSEQAVLDVFDIDKSARIIRTFGKVKDALTEGEKEGIDLAEHAIFAKAASDHVGLGAKIDKERK